jgi:hypothetical protein
MVEQLSSSRVQINLYDQMRRKRHRVIYEVAGLVSKSEAQQDVAFTKDFVMKSLNYNLARALHKKDANL